MYCTYMHTLHAIVWGRCGSNTDGSWVLDDGQWVSRTLNMQLCWGPILAPSVLTTIPTCQLRRSSGCSDKSLASAVATIPREIHKYERRVKSHFCICLHWANRAMLEACSWSWFRPYQHIHQSSAMNCRVFRQSILLRSIACVEIAAGPTAAARPHQWASTDCRAGRAPRTHPPGRWGRAPPSHMALSSVSSWFPSGKPTPIYLTHSRNKKCTISATQFEMVSFCAFCLFFTRNMFTLAADHWELHSEFRPEHQLPYKPNLVSQGLVLEFQL